MFVSIFYFTQRQKLFKKASYARFIKERMYLHKMNVALFIEMTKFDFGLLHFFAEGSLYQES